MIDVFVQSLLPQLLFPADLEELAGGPTIDFDRKSGSATRYFKVNYVDAITAIAVALPAPYISAGIIFIPPTPFYPGIPALIISKVSAMPLFDENVTCDAGVGVYPIQYKYAKITLTYSTPEYNYNQGQQSNDGPGGNQGSTGGSQTTYISHKVSVGGEFLTWPTKSLFWEQPADPTLSGFGPKQVAVGDDVQCGVIVPTIEHQITWHFVPFPPWNAIRQCIGKVNAYFFAGSPPETLIFLGVEASRELTNEGVRSWSLEYKFSEKNQNPFDNSNPQGWNFFMRNNGANAGTFQRLMRKPPAGAGINGGGGGVQTSLDYTTGTGTLVGALGILGLVTVQFNTAPDPFKSDYFTIDAEQMQPTGWVYLIGTNQIQFTVNRGYNGTAVATHADGATVTLGDNLLNLAVVDLDRLWVKNTPAGFPANGNFDVIIDNEQLTVNTNGGSTKWEIVARAQQGTALATHANKTAITRAAKFPLAFGVNATQTVIILPQSALALLPAVPPFNINIEGEIMQVIAIGTYVSGGTTYALLTVLRGVQGTTARAHAANVNVYLEASGVYNLTDFTFLFLPGLILG